jgi:flagellin
MGRAEEGARCGGNRTGAATQGLKKMGARSEKGPQIHASNKEKPMSLGVLNNLNAIYAEHNLNNSSNSLSTTLQQLSSGSKINSGADDAAGLSLVNGLQANAQALTQSATNATEGVGLLKVADGALSQVTNLLNRAVTLATEASNGTLTDSQDTAANQEYQSILSEISNIGSTTTFNQQQVFNSSTSIYTGDSSSQGASITSLNIRSLSSDNVGDSNGAMAYSNGQNNVFIDLSANGINASVNDSLGAPTATTTVTVNYLTKGANGATVSASTPINVGSGTKYQNTAQGLINAINDSGLGLTASFGTAASAGTGATNTAVSATDTNSALATGSSDTGIVITGSGVGVNTQVAGNYTNGVGEIGTVTVEQASDKLSGTMNLTDANGNSHTIALGVANSTDTLANLATAINSSGYGITAAINTINPLVNASGSHAINTALTLTSASSQAGVSGTSIVDTAAAPTTIALSGVSGTINTAGYVLNKMSVASASDTVSGVLTVTADLAAAATSNYNMAGQTLQAVAAYVNANNGAGQAFFDINAQLTNNNTTLSFVQTAPKANAQPVVVLATGSQLQDSAATNGTATVQQTAALAFGAPAVSTAFGQITVSNANDMLTGGVLKLTDAAGTQTPITLGTQGQTDTLTNLMNYINTQVNSGSGTSKIAASLDTTGTILTLKTTAVAGGTAPTLYASTPVATSLSLTGTPTTGQDNSTLLGTLVLPTAGNSGDALTGSLTIGTETITLGTPGKTNNMANLAQTINSSNLGVTVALNSAGTAMSFSSPNSSATSVTFTNAANDTPAGAALTFNTYNKGVTSSQYYSVGISGTINDTTTTGGTQAMGLSFDRNGSSGTATISYSDAAGQSLSATKLSSQADARDALTALNSAISDVAAQDGYIGAMINTLNAVSQVLSTQSENVTSAQNAVQATDYAAASSNMSKYEILSQTGISALAQANSVQQEVTKLLQ